MTGVAGLLLAAGGGSRFGRPKALVEVDGRPLVERAAAALLAGGCAPVVVVLGAAADEVAQRADLSAVRVVRNPGWADGLSGSLRAGLDACAGADAALVAVVDQPGLSAAAVRRVVARWREQRSDAVMATYDGRQGHPVLLSAPVWPAVLATSTGDEGARTWLRMHPDRVDRVECADVGAGHDVDTPADLGASPAAEA